MTPMSWQGVMPAITTPFQADGSVDLELLSRHVSWLLDTPGMTGIVALGSLGEGSTLADAEKVEILKACVAAAAGRAPVVAGIGSASTHGAVALAREAAAAGCAGLMVLPPYVHKGPWAEMQVHLDSVFRATDLSCMLYNNPIAYGVDVLPGQVALLAARHENLHAVKESSGDIRRITAIRELLGDRLAVFAGLDDLIVEAIHAGATGWIAGLVNALPRESAELFELACKGRDERVRELYGWFLPLLRLDTVPEFVQMIKLVQQEVGMGSERVRAPRLALQGERREGTLRTIRAALADRPDHRVD